MIIYDGTSHYNSSNKQNQPLISNPLQDKLILFYYLFLSLYSFTKDYKGDKTQQHKYKMKLIK